MSEAAEETWKKVSRFKAYTVSNLGRVRSHHRASRPAFLKATADASGCPHVDLYPADGDSGGKRHAMVARLVLAAFVRKPRANEIAMYRDGNPSNLASGNLAWGRRAEALQQRKEAAQAA